MAVRKIKAKFFGGCTVVIDSRVVMSQVGYKTAEKHIEDNGYNGIILQEFIDEDGWRGYYIFSADLSDDTE